MKRFAHILVAASILAIGGLILSFVTSETANRDSLSYWATGKQLAHHLNPYDGPQILAREQSAGYSHDRPFFMRSPPTAFLLALPLSLFSAGVSGALWSIAIIAALMSSIGLVWKMQGQPPGSLHLLGYLFPPVLACLLAGQIGIFIMLGVTLFLYWLPKRPYQAGAALIVCFLKPHLFVPFAAVFIFWALSKKAYKALGGVACALGVSLLSGFLIDPHGWSEYRSMITMEKLSDELIPSISLLFRLVIHRDWIWLQLLPVAVGTLWAVRYYASNYEEWDWREQGMIILLVSVMVSPYAWFTDEAVLLPAILLSLYRRSLTPYACITGVALVEVMAGAPIASFYYLWTAPAWLIWRLT